MEIIDCIKELQKNNILNIKGMALVTEKSYEVFFYGEINGKIYQSNNMIEENLVSVSVIEDFYKKIKDLIIESEQFKNNKMNIVTFDDIGTVNFKFKELDCRIYEIKKEWRLKNGFI